MLLLDKLYHINSLTITGDNSFTATITFNNGHEILKGHFPGSPIIPGACIVQITGELLSTYLREEFSIVKSKKIKFTNSINPLVNNIIDFCFNISEKIDNRGENDNVACGITVQAGETVFAKISAEYNTLK